MSEPDFMAIHPVAKSQRLTNVSGLHPRPEVNLKWQFIEQLLRYFIAISAAEGCELYEQTVLLERLWKRNEVTPKQE